MMMGYMQRRCLALGLAALMIGGCGDDQSGEQAQTAREAAPAATAAAPAMPAGGPLTIMAPAAPGGGWDQTARALQQVMQQEQLAANPQVINVPGAGGTIGLARTVNAHSGDPDFLMVTGLIMMGAILTNDSAVSLDQVTPIARLIGEYEVLVVPAESPYRTLEDFVAAWRSDPGAQAIAGGSAGGTDHMLAGLLAQAVGVDVTRVNYLPHSGGGESLASLLGGHVAAGINGFAELQSYIEDGSLRALAISSEQRVEGLDIPTFVEQGVDVTLANWRGVAAPPGIDERQKQSLIMLVDRVYKSPAWKEILERNNWIDLYLSGQAFETFLDREAPRVEAVLKSIGLVKEK